jgi:hypothetical protein
VAAKQNHPPSLGMVAAVIIVCVCIHASVTLARSLLCNVLVLFLGVIHESVNNERILCIIANNVEATVIGRKAGKIEIICDIFQL